MRAIFNFISNQIFVSQIWYISFKCYYKGRSYLDMNFSDLELQFDLSSRPWKMDPLPVVKTIQSMIGKTQATRRQEMNIEELLDAMQIKVRRKNRNYSFLEFVHCLRILSIFPFTFPRVQKEPSHKDFPSRLVY